MIIFYTLNHLTVQTNKWCWRGLFVLNTNTWNCVQIKLLVLDSNTWSYLTVLPTQLRLWNTPTASSPNKCSGYDTKQSDGVVPEMLEFWGMWSTPSLSLLLDPLWPRMVAPDGVLSLGQIELNCVLMVNSIAWNRTVLTFNCVWTKTIIIQNWIVWIRTVWLNWIAWNRNVFDN